MKQGTIFTNAALAAVLATSMATAPALSGLAHSQGATLAGVAYAAQAAQATPIESVVITRDWTATDEENQVIIDKAEAAELVGLKPLKDYLSGETVAAADFLTIDVETLALIDADLAKLVKQHNLDAIHDTVHEMARDEARHGKAFEGLLKRYFGK